MNTAHRDGAGTGRERLTRRVAISLAAAMIALAAAAVVAVTLALTNGGATADAAQLDQTQQGCMQWIESAPADGATTSAWCTAMTGWMRHELDSGQMTGAMMWGNASSLLATCQRWMATGAAAGSGVSPAACTQMVGWMTGHNGGWSSWMMTGRMMGR